MKRYAYFLSNTEGLTGIVKDVRDFKAFLLSLSGGAWKATEFGGQPNCSLKQVTLDLDWIRNQKFDYVIFYYSGHGSWERGTVLEINETEHILERATWGLAERQLSVFDCCRVVQSNTIIKNAIARDESFNSADSYRQVARMKFDRLVANATSQRVDLYACEVGECATATSSGSIYTQALLSVAENVSRDKDVSAVGVHDLCCSHVVSEAKKYGVSQNPKRSCSVADIPGAIPFAIRCPSIVI